MTTEPSAAEEARDRPRPVSPAVRNRAAAPRTPADRAAAPRTRADRWIPWALATAVAALYTAFAVTQWRLLESPSWDLGIFTQLAKAYAHLEAPIVPIKGEGFNLLGDHFHPLLVLLGPVYRLFPSGLGLLILQAVLFGLSVVPVTSVARELLGRGRGTALGVAYGLSWGLQGAVAAQFHEIAFAVPLLAFALAAFLRGRWWACALWAAPLVFVKEDLGLTVAALGLVMVWRGWRGWRSAHDGGPLLPALRGDRQAGIGAGLTVWGVAWSALAILVLLPALNPGGRWDYVDRLAAQEERSVLQALLDAFVPGEKYVTVLLLVAAAGIVGMRSPLVWLWVPTLAWRFLGTVEYYWGWQWHYSAILMPVAAAAIVDAVARHPRVRSGTASLGVAVALTTTVLMLPVLPLARLVQPQTWELADRHDAAMAAVDAVPRGATVEADIYLMAYLVPRARVYWAGNTNPAPQYVQLDTLRRTWPDHDITDAASFAEGRHPGTDYDLVLDADGYQVARRVG
ncbi:DUF2079 domain-containing protein [Georgenia yuyongxinii]|uniref:DUF2079 domain-containing protein n=1 Tax=Georgenia yuyongxinii TaxID=2589797 RepID=A0A552WT93_9MICO|nr:DUF2079 domain-containing protein [Georgenia yuyongxinii]TRW45974.1 DUF2079 domain-containing protein [Georgenia yuyongxinii]